MSQKQKNNGKKCFFFFAIFLTQKTTTDNIKFKIPLLYSKPTSHKIYFAYDI